MSFSISLQFDGRARKRSVLGLGQEGARFDLLIVSVEGRQANAVQRREIESGMLRAMALGLDLLLMGLGSNLLG